MRVHGWREELYYVVSRVKIGTAVVVFPMSAPPFIRQAWCSTLQAALSVQGPRRVARARICLRTAHCGGGFMCGFVPSPKRWWWFVINTAPTNFFIMDALQPFVDQTRSFVKTSPWWISSLVALGSFGAARLAYQTLSVFLQTFILSGTSLRKFGAKKGAWAVVTGASDGIGKEFATQLAGRGFNVLLVARNAAVLSTVGQEIESKYPGTQTAIHTIDFAKADEAAYEAFARQVAALDVGVLVNNVGKSHAYPAYLVDTPLDEMRDIVQINVNATLRVTYSVLPGMIKQKRGLILNIGSFAGSVPSPMLATYSGTKAFLSTFTSALAEEVRQHKIVVEHVNTHFVVSKLSKIRHSSLLVPTPKSYVRSVLTKIGLACGAAYSGRPETSTPYWSHALLDWLINAVGMPWVFILYTHNLHKDIRRRALKKLAKTQ
ncbi:Very-long-chain 3-oxoacyl-CoA reductase [Mycena indigotica]|uniref:Very-long-chain 3-oxoacyl-CoA reductase n=1 Tax=Mycena indigotica TaxID=2126181 RepID=A0A8H6SXW2_9AGAR|nr:Very-long-chain 3-oxoacyl-CoA reductase [Mycena indigotica]KAF7307155.1 Very-long-chain 3-oxoacyl-CoA reductase [Mycena indigotica]